jgi:hypothetical protein
VTDGSGSPDPRLVAGGLLGRSGGGGDLMGYPLVLWSCGANTARSPTTDESTMGCSSLPIDQPDPASEELAVSPRYLSRVFRRHCGMSLALYRNEPRTRIALEAIAAGVPSLALLAAELGFADQAHLRRHWAGELALGGQRKYHPDAE